MCRWFVGWLAAAAYLVSLPGMSAGMANAALGLLDAHRVETSVLRGNDLVIVLHHDGPHAHAPTEMPRAAGGGSPARATGSGIAHDEDHVLVVPGAMDSSARNHHAVVQPPLAGKETALFAASPWRMEDRASLCSRLAGGAPPRAGPPLGRGVTELRI